jgi:hypothetical protein
MGWKATPSAGSAGTGPEQAFYRSVSVEFRSHRQRETVPSGFVELSTYRVK